MRIGLGGLVVLLVLSLVFKQDFFSLLAGGDGGGVPTASAPTGAVSTTPEEEKLVEFVSFVLDDAQQTWTQLLAQHGTQYRHAKLVLFRDAIQSACGLGEAASGPFYCPGDERVYIDLGFYDELRRRFGAPGDFAQAYVLVRDAQRRRPGSANQLSVALELQADCYAGIWARSTAQRDILEQGDVEEGLAAAAAVGDDRIQKMSGTAVNPETWTHGSSGQRVRWFNEGFNSGRIEACNTFR
jgi:predicted metalloprotease